MNVRVNPASDVRLNRRHGEPYSVNNNEMGTYCFIESKMAISEPATTDERSGGVKGAEREVGSPGVITECVKFHTSSVVAISRVLCCEH